MVTRNGSTKRGTRSAPQLKKLPGSVSPEQDWASQMQSNEGCSEASSWMDRRSSCSCPRGTSTKGSSFCCPRGAATKGSGCCGPHQTTAGLPRGAASDGGRDGAMAHGAAMTGALPGGTVRSGALAHGAALSGGRDAPCSWRSQHLAVSWLGRGGVPLLMPCFFVVLLLPLPSATRAAIVMTGRSRASSANQEAERAALLALSSALKPSAQPTFWTDAGWLPSNGGANPAPCASGNSTWKYINCTTTSRVALISLSSDNGVPGQLLRGSIPWASLSPLTLLSSFTASQQSISGPALPSNITSFPALRHLDLSYNQLTTLPDQLSLLPNLSSLRLNGNGVLAGTLPDSMSSLSALSLLNLRYNALTGPLPSSWASLRTLQYLDLQHNQLSGSLPDSFSSLTHLTLLNVAQNQVQGTVPSSWGSLNSSMINFQVAGNQLSGLYPSFLSSFSSLYKLDLSTNQFLGPVPLSLWTAPITDADVHSNYFNGTVPANRTAAIRFADNCFSSVEGASSNAQQKATDTCTAYYQNYYAPPTPPSSPSSSPNIGLIVGVSAAITVVIVLSAVLLFLHFQKGQRLARRLRKGTTQSTREFRISELKSATNNWNMVLGRGGYGTVYKATLKDGTVVAVKRLDQVSAQGDAEFIREVELLSRVHHRHLVNLVGFCGERGERALIYEYMGLGSLYDHIHGECAKEQPLSWDSRIKIAIHVAFGLDYLHFGADPPLIHRDIKSANILLSEDGYAKVADFGLCKEAPVGISTDGTAQLVPQGTEVKGSFGYLDPEYVNTSLLSEKSDVYSYGVVLLEMITGKKSIHDWQPLAYWAEPYLEDPNKLEQLVDPSLDSEYDPHELQILCDIARSCTYDQAAQRPAIRDVAQALVENLGRVVASTISDTDPSILSSEMASLSDPNDTAGMSSTYGSTPSDYSFRNAASASLLVGLKHGEEGGENGDYVMSMGADGTKPPVPVGKSKDTM